MKSDFNSPPPGSSKYTGVNLSQGRVASDRDWNEASAQPMGAVSEKLAGRTGADPQTVREIMAPLARLGDGLAGAAEKLVREMAGDRWVSQESHYEADPATGEIRFGDGQRGARPATGQDTITAAYGHGAGTAEPPAAPVPPFPDAIREREPAGDTLTRGLHKLHTWLALAGVAEKDPDPAESSPASGKPPTAAHRLDGLRRELARQAELAMEVGARRPHFFEGKQLSAADFQAEQQYAAGQDDADAAASAEKSAEPRKRERIDPADLHLRRPASDDDD